MHNGSLHTLITFCVTSQGVVLLCMQKMARLIPAIWPLIATFLYSLRVDLFAFMHFSVSGSLFIKLLSLENFVINHLLEKAGTIPAIT